ncbi:MAG: Glutamyl-tRNA(Gln) amidotransferase subunit D [Methanocella sp. PtaU1.Bin125]|nr:MAG: Glutamyl-tRNA(Gln) amidotransferase subunit D [Methanocella sp. PtaU1.Bin125]
MIINGKEFEEGDRVRVSRDGITYEGILMPSRSGNIVLKMKSGYNVGISPEGCAIEFIEKERPPSFRLAPHVHITNKDLPKVSILSTGGTIASRVDYRTGAVSSQFTPDDIMDAIPELTEIANYDGEVLSMIFSEDMDTSIWQNLARSVYRHISEGSQGIIITHGTDTLQYTAAALSFMVQSPVPIVLVGSQRSSDRPSSDNAMNAICAATVAVSDIAGASVVMHGSTSDDFCYVHRGTRVRKMHTSARTAFQSVNEAPIARVDYGTRKITVLDDYVKRGEKELALRDRMEPKCALVKFYPGMPSDIIDHYKGKGYRGIVLEGTGLGHVSRQWLPAIRNAIADGVTVVMTSQCINGRVCDRVYSTGIDLINAGVIEGQDMLAEVALVKLMWVLGQTQDKEEARRMMQTDIAGEINWRSTV